MLYKNKTIIETWTLIFLYMLLFLIGMAMTVFSQGLNNNGGFITDAGTTSHSYIEFSGSGDMTLSGTTADQTALGNVNVDFTGTGTYKLTIPHDSYITIEGGLTLSDSLLLEADNSYDMSSLITNGTVSGAYAIVEQHIYQDQWQIVSSPVSAAQAGVYFNCYLFDWNEADSSFSSVTSTTQALNVGEGYHLWSFSSGSGTPVGPTDVAFTGLLNTGNYSPALTYTSGLGKGDGFNEIGNPYPSAIDWNGATAWNRTNIDATIYVYDGTQYKTWNGTSGTLANGEITPTKGFWVKANAASPSITIPNSERVHSSNTYKSGDELNIFSINVFGNSYSDEIILGINTAATNGFDSEYDAYKLFGIEAAPQLYSLIGNTKCAVNLLHEINEDIVVPLGFRVGAAMEYIFEAEGLDVFNPSIWVYLEDKSAGNMTNLRECPVYTFYAGEGLDEERFVLHFKTNVNDIDQNVFASDIDIYSYDDMVFVNYQMEVPGKVVIYDVLGKEVLSENLNANKLTKLTLINGRGYYIVKVISETKIETKKVLIK